MTDETKSKESMHDTLARIDRMIAETLARIDEIAEKQTRTRR